MENTIPVTDYEPQVHELKVFLNLIGFQMSYQQVDLLYRAMDLYEIKQSEFSVKDAIEVQMQWEEHWKKYNENKHKQKPKSNKHGRYNNGNPSR